MISITTISLVIFGVIAIIYISICAYEGRDLGIKFALSFIEKIFSYFLIILMFITIMWVVTFSMNELILNLNCLNNFVYFLKDLSINFLRIFGFILLIISIFEFFRRIREYLPLSRPNPRSLLASFGIVVLTSVMASILIFSNIPKLIMGERAVNLLFLAVVLGIGIVSIFIVYNFLPHIFSNVWITCKKENNNFFLYIRLLIKEEKTKAIKIEIFNKKWNVNNESLKIYKGENEIYKEENREMPFINLLDNKRKLHSVIPLTEDGLYTCFFTISKDSENSVKKIYINIEDETGRDIIKIIKFRDC